MFINGHKPTSCFVVSNKFDYEVHINGLVNRYIAFPEIDLKNSEYFVKNCQFTTFKKIGGVLSQFYVKVINEYMCQPLRKVKLFKIQD